MTAKSKERENDDVKEEIKNGCRRQVIGEVKHTNSWLYAQKGKDEEWFKKGVVRDITTKKIVERDWARLKPVDQIPYENLLSKVVNQETGECYTKKDEAGFTNK
jgi:hypothetical protein